MDPRAQQLQQELSLLPHPEGGFYSEIYRSPIQVDHNNKSRSALTSIYFLLTRGDVSRWHVVDADESWHFYEGDPVELYIMPPDFSSVQKILIGLYSEETKPTHVVPAGWWQASRSSGEYSLVGCTVAPGFEFQGFRMLNDDEKTQVKNLHPEFGFLV
jgi:predicted cupin superfamily sugar epimerase